MNYSSFEQQKLQEIAAEYRARGYEVFIEPGSENLPEFLEGFHPDLIAQGKSESVVVEMKIGTETAASERFQELVEVVRQHPGWRFSLVIVDPKADEVVPLTQPLISREEIAQRLEKAEELFKEGATVAALLLAWVSVEALLRHTAAREGLPLERVPSTALMKELFSQGVLSRRELEVVQRALAVRNSLAHGFVADDLERNFTALIEIAHRLAAGR